MSTDFEIHRPTYEWTARLLTLLRKALGLNLKLHGSRTRLEDGEIFVFNHFARFETFIPQYLIYLETEALCRSVAASEFFVEGSTLSNYLRRIGAVPNTHPRLFLILASEILRGRKVIIFPEGGMIKDRRVLDGKRRYSVYSRTGAMRKPHTGAAILALVLDAFKLIIQETHRVGGEKRLEAWAAALDLDSPEALLAAVQRPTLIVPANITFYPLRISDNVLHKVAERVSGGMSPRLSEEFLVESNILLKDTDMDVRLGEPVRPSWSWWERRLIAALAGKLDPQDGLPALSPGKDVWKGSLVKWRMSQKARRLRDQYMAEIYKHVTVNLNHLASRALLSLAERGQGEISDSLFRKTLYGAVKKVQSVQSVQLHRGLQNPDGYGGLLDSQCPAFDQFLSTVSSAGLLEFREDRYVLLPKLRQKQDFDQVRLENPISVHANEVAPVLEVCRAVDRAIVEASTVNEQKLARMRFDDQLRAHAWDKTYFSKPRYQEINEQETATESGEPFLLLPDKPGDLGVVLVHGLLASPAEVRPFGEKLKSRGYPVVGVRLQGHGTSPWDLHERRWQDWLDSVRKGYSVISPFARGICMVGFSVGGALSLLVASDPPQNLVGVAAVCVPFKMRGRGMLFVPLAHGANWLVRSISSSEGIILFRPHQSEHPQINYNHVPLQSLHELRLMVEELEKRLPDIRCAVSLIHATDDPLVDPESAPLIYEKLGAPEKSSIMVDSNRHGILYEDIGETHQTILEFLASISPFS